MLALLDTCSEAGLRTASEDVLVADLYCDASQDVSRKAWGFLSQGLGTNTTSAEIYIYSRQGFMAPVEKLFILGFRRDVRVSSLLDSHVKDLAGECMALPCVAQVLLSACLTLPFEGLRKPLAP